MRYNRPPKRAGDAAYLKGTTKESCPYLGLKDDPYTNLAFANTANHCQAVSPPEAVVLDHQDRACLTYNYRACVVYRGKTGTRPGLEHLPAGIRSGSARRSRPKINIPLQALLLILGVLLIPLVIWLTSKWEPMTSFGAILPEDTPTLTIVVPSPTLKSEKSQTPFSPDTAMADGVAEVPTEVAISSATVTFTDPLPPPPEEPEACTPRKDWPSYTVRSGDTLYEIALLAKISLKDLLAANCLKASAIIRPGQVIYVPSAINPPPPTAILPTAVVAPPSRDT